MKNIGFEINIISGLRNREFAEKAISHDMQDRR